MKALSMLHTMPATKLRSIIRHLFIGKESQTKRLAMLGWLALVGFPLYYGIWTYLFPQPYENLALRLGGMLVMTPLFFVQRFYRKNWFEIYFFGAVTYVGPFFFIFMFLMNGGSEVWSQSLLIAIIVLFHFDCRFALLSLGAGVVIACVAYVFATSHPAWPDPGILTSMPIVAFAILSVSIVKIGRSILIEEKLRGMASALGVVAHELRTPLRSVDASARGLKRYLPTLTKFYLTNPQASAVTSLDTDRLAKMGMALERIQAEVQYMNSAIDLLLVNTSETARSTQTLQVFQVSEVIAEAMQRYPFENEQQRALVSVQVDIDYSVAGNSELFMMVLFNLLKNALKAIAKAGKGEIQILAVQISGENRLVFRDTGCGIPEKELPRIFRRFHTFPPNAGTGIGLAFCRDTLGAWGATVTCCSREGTYTQFVIRWPG